MIDTTQIRESVAAICQKFGEEYWRNLDKEKEYPTDFVKEMTTSGFLNILTVSYTHLTLPTSIQV